MAAQTELILQTVVKWTETATKALNDVKGSLDSINKSAQTATKGTKSFTDKLKENEQWFQALWIWAWVVTAGMVIWIRWAVNEATNFENSLIWLRSIVEWTGWDFWKAEKFIQSFTSDWLVPVWDAATSLKNLLSRWFWLEEASTIMLRFKDSAAFWRQASLWLWEAIKWATEWLKNENSILVDNAWVTKNVSVMWKEYADSIWVWVGSLTTAQKRQAELNWILNETKFQIWDAAKLSDTYSWAQARSEAATLKLQQTIWTALMPAMTTLKTAITDIITPITKWAWEHPKLTSYIVLTITALSWLTAWAVALWFAIWPLIAWVKALWVALMFLTANPIWLTITAIAALVAAWVLLYQNWDYVIQKAWELWSWLADLYNKFGFLLWPLKLLIDTWVLLYQNWDTIKAKATILWSALSTTFQWIKSMTIEVFDAIYDYWVWKIQWIIDFVNSAVNIIKNSIKKTMDLASSVGGWISSVVSKVSWKRATWWPVWANKTYLVWEKWPELFTPSNSWQIIPNNRLWSSSWNSINITISWVFGSDAVDEIWDMLVKRLQKSVFI